MRRQPGKEEHELDTGGAREPDQLAAPDPIAYVHQSAAQVARGGEQPVAVIETDLEPTAIEVVGDAQHQAGRFRVRA